MDDQLDQMIQKVRERRKADEPLFVTAARVLEEDVDALDDADILAFESVGFEFVIREGCPSEITVPSVVRMIRTGRPYDHIEIDPEDRPRVMFLGFVALVGEALMAEENDQPATA